MLCAVLCTTLKTVVHNDTHTRKQFLHFCMLGLDIFVCAYLSFIF